MSWFSGVSIQFRINVFVYFNNFHRTTVLYKTWTKSTEAKNLKVGRRKCGAKAWNMNVGRKEYITEAINMNLAGRKCRAEAKNMKVGRRNTEQTNHEKKRLERLLMKIIKTVGWKSSG